MILLTGASHSGTKRHVATTQPITTPTNGNPSVPAPSGPAWERLEDQLGWYDRKSGVQKRWFQRFKVAQIVIAASIPVVAAAGGSAALAGGLGATIVVLEGMQQLYQ